MLKEKQVVMLATNQKATKDSVHYPSSIAMFDNKLYSAYDCEYSMLDAAYQHLYIISDEKIKVLDDWFYDTRDRCVSKNPARLNFLCKKVIATTDSSLGLPRPSDSFITKYIKLFNAGTPITKVMVEYKQIVANELDGIQFMAYDKYKIKVDSNNCITITKVKDSWTREELYEILNAFGKDCLTASLHGKLPSDATHFTVNWIQQNL